MENGLAIKVFSLKFLLVFFIVFVAGLFSSAFLGSSMLAGFSIIGLFITYVLSIILGVVVGYFNGFTVKLLQNGTIVTFTLRDKISEIIAKPHFIDLFIKPSHTSIRIRIADKGKELSHFTLKNGDDLTKIIDSLITLLDLELVENQKLSKGEILSFKSKNSMLPAYSDIQIKTIPNQMILVSKTDSSKWTEFHFHENEIRNYRKSVDLTEVDKFLIKPNNTKIRLEALLNDGGTIELFRHTSTEITAIRDTKLLKETLENRQELRNIEIEIIEKT